MARTGRPKTELTLTEEERAQLVRWSRRAKSSQALALRSRIVLACADGVDSKTVAERLGCAPAKMAERTGLSKSTIGRIWRSFELKPHRADGFKLSNDPLFVEKVYDIVGLYLNPPEAAVVLCVDEKSQVQALARSQPAFPM